MKKLILSLLLTAATSAFAGQFAVGDYVGVRTYWESYVIFNNGVEAPGLMGDGHMAFPGLCQIQKISTRPSTGEPVAQLDHFGKNLWFTFDSLYSVSAEEVQAWKKAVEAAKTPPATYGPYQFGQYKAGSRVLDTGCIGTVTTRPEAPISTPAQAPVESTGVGRSEQSASGSSAESQSQVAVSPNTMSQSIEVRRAEIVGSDGRDGRTVSPPAGEIGTDGPGAKSTPIAVATPEPEQSPVVKNADVALSAPTPVQAAARSDFVMSVLRAYNNHNYLALSPYLVPGHVNYFGHRDASSSFIRNDMTNDARTYAAVNCTYYPDTFTHEVSNEYSPHWVGPMLYDTITTYTEAREFNGRVHRATTRFTVGYTVVNGVTNIYAMVLKMI